MKLKNIRCEKCRHETGMVKNDNTGQIWCMYCGWQIENINHGALDAAGQSVADKLRPGGNK